MQNLTAMRKQLHRSASCSVIAALSLGLAAIADANGLLFLKDAPVSHFTDQDVQLMMQAVDAVLDDSSAAATREWRNPATGNSGRLEVRSAFATADGRQCKQLLIVNRAKTIEGRSSYPLCKSPDGIWMVDTGAKPRAKAAAPSAAEAAEVREPAP